MEEQNEFHCPACKAGVEHINLEEEWCEEPPESLELLRLGRFKCYACSQEWTEVLD